jgi:hypothetical protein
MKTRDEMLKDMREALAHHKSEAARLEAAIAALEGVAPKPAEAPPITVPLMPPTPGLPFYPPWYVPPQPTVDPPTPWRFAGHGGMCACPHCVPITWASGAITLLTDGVVAFNGPATAEGRAAVGWDIHGLRVDCNGGAPDLSMLDGCVAGGVCMPRQHGPFATH